MYLHTYLMKYARRSECAKSIFLFSPVEAGIKVSDLDALFDAEVVFQRAELVQVKVQPAGRSRC